MPASPLYLFISWQGLIESVLMMFTLCVAEDGPEFLVLLSGPPKYWSQDYITTATLCVAVDGAQGQAHHQLSHMPPVLTSETSVWFWLASS